MFLGQLNDGNNSQKFKNEIRQLLYSLNAQSKQPNQPITIFSKIYKMETIFLNTENKY